jgi:hypothetical protein
MLDCVEGDKVLGHNYDPDCYVNQRMWCHKNVSDIMLGIGSMVKLPVDILNQEALLTLVSGINTKQEADFVYHIANSEHFALVVEPMTTRSDLMIDTIFNERIRRSYGKVRN